MSKYFGFCVASKKSEKTAEQAKIIKSYKWKKTIPSFSFLTNNPLFFFLPPTTYEKYVTTQNLFYSYIVPKAWCRLVLKLSMCSDLIYICC